MEHSYDKPTAFGFAEVQKNIFLNQYKKYTTESWELWK